MFSAHKYLFKLNGFGSQDISQKDYYLNCHDGYLSHYRNLYYVIAKTYLNLICIEKYMENITAQV